MKMRKIMTIMLVLALLLCGCGKSGEAPGGTVIPAQTPETEAAQAQTEAPEQTEPEKQASLGVIQGGCYENEYLGYGFRLGEGWVYKMAEELQDISGFAQEAMEGTDLEGYAGSATQIIDFQAENSEQLVSMNVVYNRLSMQEQLAAALMGEEEFLEGILGMRDSMTEAYANMGIEVLSMEKVTVTFLGEERPAIFTETTVNGMNYYILQLYEVHLGGSYNAVITLGSFVENNTESLLELFYAL